MLFLYFARKCKAKQNKTKNKHKTRINPLCLLKKKKERKKSYAHPYWRRTVPYLANTFNTT